MKQKLCAMKGSWMGKGTGDDSDGEEMSPNNGRHRLKLTGEKTWAIKQVSILSTSWPSTAVGANRLLGWVQTCEESQTRLSQHFAGMTGP